MGQHTPAPLLPETASREEYISWLAEWIACDAMRSAASTSGWSFPEGPFDSVLDELVNLSGDWEFRLGAERHALTDHPAVVNGRQIDENLAASWADALGLIGGMPVRGSFTHAVALGGMARACRNRVALMKELAASHEVGRLVILSAHRPLQGAELEHVIEFGWGPLVLESEAATAAARELLSLPGVPDDHDEWDGMPVDAVPAEVDPQEYLRRRSWSVAHWESLPPVDVIVAPSEEPKVRRANTADQLSFWANRASLTAQHRVLLVTTEHYVPFQQLQALRVIAARYGCRVVTTGTSWNPVGRFRAAAYLQEIRSALLAAQQLRDALRLIAG